MPRTVALAGFALVAVAATCPAPPVRAGDAVTWLDAVAERPVDHAVMVKGPFAAAHEKVTVRGPVAVVVPDPAADAAACLAVYRIAAPADEPVRHVMVDGADAVRLGPAEFLLVPAKRLADGPAPAGDGGGVYEVRPILDAAGAGGPDGRGRPTHVGLPVDYRHHFERIPVADPGRGLAILAGREAEAAPAAVAIVDDFGTNRLVPGRTARAGAWVAVRTGGGP